MFKNFDKVFKFTFRNQAMQKGYKALTFTLGAILRIAPIAVLLILSWTSKKSDADELKSCGADKIYIVNEAGDVSDYSILKDIKGNGYSDITYVTAATVDEALDTIKGAGEKKSFVLHVTKNEKEEMSAGIILPDDSSIETKQAKNYFDAIDKMSMMFVVAFRGISIQDMAEVTKTISTDAYSITGWKNGTSLYSDKSKANEQNNDRIQDVFSVLITMLVCMIMYCVVMAYGAGIAKNIVMEKTSKLMDTLLISVKPEALIFGKLSGVLAAGLLQFFFWIAMIVGGVIAGVILCGKIFPDVDSPVIIFLKSLGSMNLFQPLQVILAFVVLIFGILLYASMAAFAGAAANTLQQATSNQGFLFMILIVSYFLVIFKGIDINVAPTWLFICPFTAAMILPTGLLLNSISTTIAISGVLILVVLALAFVIIAGRVYKAMALYKGDGGLRKAFKVLSMK